MAMKFTGNVGKDTEDFNKKVHEMITEIFARGGERFLQDCRSQPGSHELGFYEDKTTNLRNSTQYLVFWNGELVKASDSPAATDTASVAQWVEPQGFQLIGVAGMNYASYVESKGYNVITSQKEVLFVNLTRYFKELQQFVNGHL